MPASALMNVMIKAARKAGRSLTRDFGEVEQLQVSVKGPANFVSAADHRAEDIIFEELTRAREGYGFLMEERGEVEGVDKTHRWIVDPLDGTTNFLHGIPIFAVSIALERDGQIVAGVVYNPVLDEMYTAEKGKGAFLNDRRIRVASRRSLSDAVVCVGKTRKQKGGSRQDHETIASQVAGMRRYGAAALDLAWTAAGRFDGFWERGLEPWDIAAGSLLVREAGGIITDTEGGQHHFKEGNVLAGNAQIHRALSNLLSTGVR